MLSRRPSNGLYTYNFELGRLRVTTHEPATSLILDQRDHLAKLILTLRQFRDVPRGKTKKTETGYLLILHSGTTAVVGLPHKRGLPHLLALTGRVHRRDSTSGKSDSPLPTGERRHTRSGAKAMGSSFSTFAATEMLVLVLQSSHATD